MTPPAGQRWSKEKPTEPGWYWWRLAPGHYPIIEEYKRDAEGNLVMYVECKGELLKFPLAPGEWLGPITPDSYQQGRAVGLREAHVFAMEAGAFYTAHRIGALIDKAQEAQGEKVVE